MEKYTFIPSDLSKESGKNLAATLATDTVNLLSFMLHSADLPIQALKELGIQPANPFCMNYNEHARFQVSIYKGIQKLAEYLGVELFHPFLCGVEQTDRLAIIYDETLIFQYGVEKGDGTYDYE